MDDVTWLLVEARRLASGPEAFGALCDRLLADGVPLDRTWYGGLTLHPLLYASGCRWRPGQGATNTARPHGFETTAMWTDSPAIPLLAGAPPIRRRVGIDPLDFPVVRDLAVDGGTDYLAFALDIGDRPTTVVSFATSAPGGFRDDTVARLLALRPAMGAVLEIFARRHVATTVVSTYLGAEAGARVLSGQIRRGDGETILAALYVSDLRGFTELSGRLSRPELLRMLDDAFEAQVAAVEAEGGTVLKFIGDGMLAIFRAGDDDGRTACRSALAAARSAFARVATANDHRREPIRFGVGLHYGDVVFGNIGSPHRLDFTVIGPAVNLAARLEGLCARTGQGIVASADAASRCEGMWTSLGHHEVKGAGVVEAFAPG